MVFNRQKERVGAITESPPKTHPATNIREVRTPSRTVFTQKQNELLFEKFFNALRMWRVMNCIVFFCYWFE